MGIQETNPATGRDFELTSRLAAIVESSTDAVIGKALDGTITSWNSGAADMYGYSAAEMVGRNVSMLIPADRPGELAPILARLARGSGSSISTRNDAARTEESSMCRFRSLRSMTAAGR